MNISILPRPLSLSRSLLSSSSPPPFRFLFLLSCSDIQPRFPKLIAEQGWVQVNGGSADGLMGAATKGAVAVGGHVDAVLMERFLKYSDSTLFRETVIEDGFSTRKKSLYQRGDALIALPGGLGTLDELAEVAAMRQHGLHLKPIVLVNTAGFYQGLRSFLDTAIDNFFVTKAMNDVFHFVDTPTQAIAFLKAYRPIHISKDAVNSGNMHEETHLAQ